MREISACADKAGRKSSREMNVFMVLVVYYG